jgi:hypothetical protein
MKINHHCATYQDRISEMVLNGYQLTEDKELYTEIRQCKQCQQFYNFVSNSMMQWNDAVPELADDNAFTEEVFSRINNPVYAAIKLHPVRSFVAAAAAVVLGLTIGWLSAASSGVDFGHDDYYATQSLELFNDDLFASDILYEMPQQ